MLKDFIQDWIIEILVAVLTALLIFIFRKIIHPYILGVLQKAPNLEGIWEGYDIDENGTEKQNSRLIIKQLGTNISAVISRRTNEGTDRIFKYKGVISSGQVLLIWKEQKSNGYNMGTMTLLLSGDLKSLKGKSVFNHHDLGRIIAIDKIYKKVTV